MFHSVSGQPFYAGHFLMHLSKLKRKAVGISRLLVSEHHDWEMTVEKFLPVSVLVHISFKHIKLTRFVGS